MSTENSRETSAASATRSRRRTTTIVVAVVAAILMIVGAIFALTIGMDGSNPSSAGGPTSSPRATPSPSGSSSSTPGASASPTPSAAPTIDPDYGAPVAETVPKDAEGNLGGGFTARLAAIESIEATGTQVGEISGPAAQVDVEVTNGTGADIVLDSVTVNAYYGKDATPASPIASPTGNDGFSGILKPGEKATARFIFTAPKDQQKTLVLTVSPRAGAPIVVFANAG